MNVTTAIIALTAFLLGLRIGSWMVTAEMKKDREMKAAAEAEMTIRAKTIERTAASGAMRSGGEYEGR